MAGYWAQSRTQILDQFDNLIIGALAYFFEAGTSTPMSVYSSAGLGSANEHPHPVVADGNARWPQVFFDDTDPDPDDPLVSGRQFYRVRVTDASGVLIYDDDSVPIIGTTPGEGGGGGIPVDQNALARVGDVKMKFCAALDPADAGWVRCNGGTISKGASGGSELASDTAQGLFEYLWNKHANIICPVVGGRGTTAVADFSAGKKLTLPDMRGRAPFGIDIMGNESGGAGIGANLIAPGYVDTAVLPGPGITTARDTVGAVGGDDEIALATAQMPAHSHDASGVPAGPGTPAVPPALPSLKAPNHGHPYRVTPAPTDESDAMGGLLLGADGVSGNKAAFTGTPIAGTGPASGDPVTLALSGQQIGGSGDLQILGNTGLAGGTGLLPSGNVSAHENMPPFMLVQFQIKL